MVIMVSGWLEYTTLFILKQWSIQTGWPRRGVNFATTAVQQTHRNLSCLSGSVRDLRIDGFRVD
jgi:hypothetical protein